MTLFVLWLAAGSLDVRRYDVVAPPVAAAAGDTVVIASVGIELSYDVKEIRATAGDTLTIRYDNAGSEMTHNFVLVRSEEDITVVGNAALNAHRNDYIPEDETDRIIIHSRLLYPGESDTFSFVVPPPGTYPYICTYSGHFTMMQGRLVSTE
ncbi:MAG: plastocyanin/azurin family copper-binding protein [Rhodothermales bacterium]